MARTALELSREEWRTYHPSKGLQPHYKVTDIDIEARKRQALKLAREAARVLREKFGAEKIVLFGTLAHAEWFSPWSDIDLAVWGIKPESFYTAVAFVTGLASSFKIDLVDIKECRPALRKVIEVEGIEI